MTSRANNSQPPADAPLTVSELNREARFLLEGNFPSVLVEGEISNIARPSSGHWYLTLKDDAAQIRCAMFRNRNMLVRFQPEDGMQVLVKGKLSLYEGRGDYQLILEKLEERGDGALRRAFEELKQKLFNEGLFDEARKQELPALPKHIGVISSPTGAAIRDILSVLKRRFPAIPVTLLPVSVQGQNSAAEIIHAIGTANRRQGPLHDLDVLVISRGGGSLEDLWSFNNEHLARAIFASTLPIVSAVGHEIDFTIADFVADLRAATPSAAAEILSPDQQEYFQLMSGYQEQFAALMSGRIQGSRQQLDWLYRQLRHPGRKLQEQAQRLDELEGRLKQAHRNRKYRFQARLDHVRTSLLLNSPLTSLRQSLKETLNFKRLLCSAALQSIQQRKQALAEQSHALNTVSPLNTLSRGYSITRNPEGHVIRNASEVKAGSKIVTRLHQGRIFSTVNGVKYEDEP